LPGVNPAAEVHATPQTGLPFAIVGIGASAGGLEAFSELLQALPADTGMAFVIIQHLSPTHGSMLAEILARTTPMPVSTVSNNMPVEPDHVYVIPPGTTMVLAEGRLQLSPRTELRGQARPIDQFMRSLAEEHGHKAIGVVLSGTGNDGTLGSRRSRPRRHHVRAGATAEHTSMPVERARRGRRWTYVATPPTSRPSSPASPPSLRGPVVRPRAPALHDADMMEILDAVREHSGVDFSGTSATRSTGASPAACCCTAWSACATTFTCCARAPKSSMRSTRTCSSTSPASSATRTPTRP
jgi:two-component system CheB/CheR fusion protein